MTELFQLSSIYSDKNIFHTSVFVSISYTIKSKAIFFDTKSGGWANRWACALGEKIQNCLFLRTWVAAACGGMLFYQKAYMELSELL